MPKGERRPAVLTDKQRAMVEKIMQGVPMAQIAREIGEHRQRLYEWQGMPHVVKFMRQCERDVRAAISARCAAAFWHSMESLREATDLTLQRLRENPEAIPDLSKFAANARLLAELHSRNLPATEGENESDYAERLEGQRRGQTILDQYSVETPRTLDMTRVDEGDPQE